MMKLSLEIPQQWGEGASGLVNTLKCWKNGALAKSKESITPPPNPIACPMHPFHLAFLSYVLYNKLVHLRKVFS